MKMVKCIIPVATLLILVLSCTRKDEPVYKPAAVKEIRIGALLSLTGAGSSTGQSSMVSLELALQDIRAYLSDVGMKENVSLETADTRTDTAEALKQLRMFYDKGIRLVIGPYSSAELAHVKEFSDSHGMLIISPSGVAVSLAIAGDNIFRFVCSDETQGEAITKMLSEDKIKVIVPLIRDDLWGNDLLTTAQDNFILNGGDVKPPVRYEPGTSGFSATLAQLDAAVESELGHHNPNEVAVYMLSFAEGAEILLEAKNYAHLNNVYWYGGSAFAQNTAVLEDTNAALFAFTHGLPCPIFGLDDAARYKWEPLRERIRSQTGMVPDVYALTAYDALWVAVLTYATTGLSPGIALLKSAFVNEAANFFGVTGNTLLDSNGDRAYGNYDFWAVKNDSAGYHWKRTAKYNSATGLLTRVTE
jgi:branched-chain amino acid transport system substrate-binding protein